MHWNLFLCLQEAVPSSIPSEKPKDEKSKPKENPEEKKKWAIPVDITSPCDDFYKRIPNPAFKVGITLIIQLGYNMVKGLFVPLFIYCSSLTVFVVTAFLCKWWITYINLLLFLSSLAQWWFMLLLNSCYLFQHICYYCFNNLHKSLFTQLTLLSRVLHLCPIYRYVTESLCKNLFLWASGNNWSDSLPSSSPVAVWVGCFPKTGCAEAGSSRLCVCSCTHVSWQNSGGRVRHRSLPEAHDTVCICWYELIASVLTMRVGVQLCSKLNTLLKNVEDSLVFDSGDDRYKLKPWSHYFTVFILITV